MKKAIKSIALILSTLAFSGCEVEKWGENNLALTDVYSITEAKLTAGAAFVATENAAMTQITVFHELGDLVVWENSRTIIRSVDLDDFENNSTETEIDFTFEELCSREVILPSGEAVDATYRRIYDVKADSESGAGEMTVTEFNGSQSKYSVSVAAESRTADL